MGELQKYLYGIISAAVVCAAIVAIAPKNKATGKLITMLCGLFLLLNVLKPIKSIDLSSIGNFADILESDSAAFVTEGIESSTQTLREVIKNRCESYVMEKASQIGANISVDILLDEGDMPVPIEATIIGNISPYAKERLAILLTQDLNIPKERQKWI